MERVGVLPLTGSGASPSLAGRAFGLLRLLPGDERAQPRLRVDAAFLAKGPVHLVGRHGGDAELFRELDDGRNTRPRRIGAVLYALSNHFGHLTPAWDVRNEFDHMSTLCAPCMSMQDMVIFESLAS